MKIKIDKDFIFQRWIFFIPRTINSKDITEILEKGVESEGGKYKALILNLKSGKKIGMEQPFFRKNWTEIENELEKVTRLKIKILD